MAHFTLYDIKVTANVRYRSVLHLFDKIAEAPVQAFAYHYELFALTHIASGAIDAVLYNAFSGSFYPAAEATNAVLLGLFGGFDDLVLAYYTQSKILDIRNNQFH